MHHTRTVRFGGKARNQQLVACTSHRSLEEDYTKTDTKVVWIASKVLSVKTVVKETSFYHNHEALATE